jgi:hypothetical protein
MLKKFHEYPPRGQFHQTLVKCEERNAQSRKLHNFFPNFKENATYIANIFHTKKYGEIGFQKHLAYLSFVQKSNT